VRFAGELDGIDRCLFVEYMNAACLGPAFLIVT